ncbi:G-protein coupled bile acid receptor 1 [Amblyraja radiata]|uniref:G-protein coupled bile acid receptor 1 n=1 Tax=Amblyraja radiata TaxID=386614 RepID=UPI001401F7BB|nr:G-protein coupled bile acid receptor 1 [Amblyraja radiata]
MNKSDQGCCNRSVAGDGLASYQLLVQWLTLPFSVVIVVGSLALVVGIAGSKRLHNSAGWFFLSLAVSDLATGLVLPSVPGLSSATDLPHGLCYLTYLLPNLVVLSLLANLLLVHADRYLHVVHPLRGRTWLRGRAWAALLAVWLLPLSFACLPLLGWNCWPAQRSGRCCCHSGHVFPPVYIYLEVYGVLMPSILAMGASNAALHRLALGQMRRIQRQHRAVQSGPTISPLEQELNLRYTRSVAGSLLVFTCCWLPYIAHLHGSFLGARVHIVLSCLGIASAALVPFALAMGNKDYLQTWARIRAKLCRRAGDPQGWP